MHFEHVLKLLLIGFENQRIRYGAIGGFAIGSLGVPRATADLDFLVHHEDLEKVHGILGQLGYERIRHTENVSHYAHTLTLWGSIDVLHAFRVPSLAMLQRTQSYPIFTTHTIRVLQPEDIIGLKVQAMANDALRRAKETADIEALLTRYGKKVDWKRLKEYYELFELGGEFQTLQERFSHAE